MVARQVTGSQRMLGRDRQDADPSRRKAARRAGVSNRSLPIARLIAASQRLAALTTIS